MKIHILQTKNAETAPKLAKHIKRCEAGYVFPEEPCFIVNYGRSTNEANLNNSLINNKLQQLKILNNKGILVPKIISVNPRTFLSSPKRTIKSCLPRNLFPLLARKQKHFKGKDIIFLKSRKSLWKRLSRVSSRDFLIQYIPKSAEFRVHVLGNEVPNICQKVPSDKATRHHPHVWCSPRGWTLVDYAGEHSKVLAELGIKVAKALGYDFGAVDIGLGKDGKFYVFEINSAPRLSKTRRRYYARFFRQKEKEYKENAKTNSR